MKKVSYESWIKTDSYLNDELTDMIMVNRNQERYSHMTPFGIKIWTDYRSSWTSSEEWFTLYDLNLSFENFENKVKEFNGRMEVFYSEDEYGTPIFDKEKDAYEFLSWYDKNKGGK